MSRISRIGEWLTSARMAAAVMMAVLSIAAAIGAAQVSKGAHDASPVAVHGASITGIVQDSNERPLAKATVYVEPSSTNVAADLETMTTTTGADGSYRISAIQPGSYMVRAQLEGYRTAFIGPVSLVEKETRRIDLTLTPAGGAAAGSVNESAGKSPGGKATAKSNSQVPQLFDEPQFTVAGVTDATSSGGHGSDVVLRRSEAEVMAKETVALGNGTSKDGLGSAKVGSLSLVEEARAERTLRERLQMKPDDVEANCALGKLLVGAGKSQEAVVYLERAAQAKPSDADAHRLLAEAEERSGDSLKAVHEYQRAAELDASEENLFAWGTELLAHRGLEAATGVLSTGNRLFPRSERMEIALGVAWYERGSFDEAAQWMEKASDLEPENAIPYLFLGRMEGLAGGKLAGAEERFARFVRIEPTNPRANYYYAVSLWRALEESSGTAKSSETEGRVEELLKRAIELDSNFAPAFLQLGILYWERGETARAVEEYQKAIAASANRTENSGLDSEEAIAEAHYRLAQAYWRSGDKAKAEAELKLQAEAKQSIEAAEERQRREVQEFVMALKQQ